MNIFKLFTIFLFVFQYASIAFSEETEITISIGPRGFGQMTPKLIEGFMKENPQIKVNWQKIICLARFFCPPQSSTKPLPKRKKPQREKILALGINR